MRVSLLEHNFPGKFVPKPDALADTMPSTHCSLHFHVVFSTKNREPLIESSWREELHTYMGGTVRGLGGISAGVGGVADHVHLLMSLRPTVCLSDFMRELKKASSAWIRKSAIPGFHWQDGYAAFSVSASACASVQRYIANQEEHHRKYSFREELVNFLNKSGVEYDPRFIN